MSLELPGLGDGIPSLPYADLGDFASAYPRLAEWWAASSWSSGRAKKAARISMHISMGVVFVQMQILGTGLMLRAQIPDPRLWCDALEGLLSLSPIPFERDPWVPADPPPGANGKQKK